MKVFQTLNGYMPTARPISCLFFIPLWWSDSTIWFVLRMIHKNISGRYIGTHWGRCSAPTELTRGQQRLSAEIYHTKSIGSWKKKLYHIRFCMIIMMFANLYFWMYISPDRDVDMVEGAFENWNITLLNFWRKITKYDGCKREVCSNCIKLSWRKVCR